MVERIAFDGEEAKEAGLKFSKSLTAENHDAIINIFGQKWLSGTSAHPLREWWKFKDQAQQIMYLNWIAGDLRSVGDSKGLEEIVRDLKHASLFASTRTTLGASALLARAKSTKSLEFFVSKNDRVPDFKINTDNGSIFYEVKQLEQSSPSKDFGRFTEQVKEQIYKTVYVEDISYPDILLVIKDATVLPDANLVAHIIKEGVLSVGNGSVEFRSPAFNIFITPNDTSTNIRKLKTLYILCPRAESENRRVFDRAKRASKQLKAVSGSNHGPLWLGVSDFQDVHLLVDEFRKRFANGELSGISNVVFHQATVTPHNAPVDCLAMLRNESCPVGGFDVLDFSPTLMYCDLREARPRQEGLSCYQSMQVEGMTPDEGEDGAMLLKMIPHLSPELLA